MLGSSSPRPRGLRRPAGAPAAGVGPWGHVNPIGPRGVYDEAKRFAEALTMAYHRHHGVDVRIVRIFNTYGTRQRVEDGRAGLQLPRQALRGEPITVFGDGSRQAVVLLRRRRGPRLPRPARRSTHRADQHRQPQRVHDPRAGRARRGVSGSSSEDRLTSRCRSTTRRSASPTSRSPARCSAGSPTIPLREGLAAHRRVLFPQSLWKCERSEASEPSTQSLLIGASPLSSIGGLSICTGGCCTNGGGRRYGSSSAAGASRFPAGAGA